MTVAFAAHEIVKTRDCKIGGCDEDAVDARGRFAGLCVDHKRVAIAEAQRQGSFATGVPSGQLGKLGHELARRARRVERASQQLERERGELRRVYLEFGVKAGFLGGGR